MILAGPTTSLILPKLTGYRDVHVRNGEIDVVQQVVRLGAEILHQRTIEVEGPRSAERIPSRCRQLPDW
jgi:hypothetical protein